jgi:hypothetical protein
MGSFVPRASSRIFFDEGSGRFHIKFLGQV